MRSVTATPLRHQRIIFHDLEVGQTRNQRKRCQRNCQTSWIKRQNECRNRCNICKKLTWRRACVAHAFWHRSGRPWTQNATNPPRCGSQFQNSFHTKKRSNTERHLQIVLYLFVHVGGFVEMITVTKQCFFDDSGFGRKFFKQYYRNYGPCDYKVL